MNVAGVLSMSRTQYVVEKRDRGLTLMGVSFANTIQLMSLMNHYLRIFSCPRFSEDASRRRCQHEQMDGLLKQSVL